MVTQLVSTAASTSARIQERTMAYPEEDMSSGSPTSVPLRIRQELKTQLMDSKQEVVQWI